LICPHLVHETEDIVKRLAIIISYHAFPEKLEESLLSLLELRPESCEIMVIQSKPYENPYELSREEVLFISSPSPEGLNEKKLSAWESIRLGLAHAEADCVYIMPIGVPYRPEWQEALSILEQNEDLGAFVLDENLEFGGLFKKEILKKLMDQNADGSQRTAEGLPDETEMDCLSSFVTLLQEDGWFCGVAAPEGYEADYAVGEEVMLNENARNGEIPEPDVPVSTSGSFIPPEECISEGPAEKFPEDRPEQVRTSANAENSPASSFPQDNENISASEEDSRHQDLSGGILHRVRSVWQKIFSNRGQGED